MANKIFVNRIFLNGVDWMFLAEACPTDLKLKIFLPASL